MKPTSWTQTGSQACFRLSTIPNPQVFYALSMGNEQSTHLGVLRRRALAAEDDHVCWIEWSMADGDRIDDRAVWAACNPAYPDRISADYLEREWAALGSDPEKFARERLGKSYWPTDEAGLWAVIPEDVWMACSATAEHPGRAPSAHEDRPRHPTGTRLAGMGRRSATVGTTPPSPGTTDNITRF